MGAALTSIVAFGAVQFYQRTKTQADRRILLQSISEEQRLFTELLKNTWDTKNLNSHCSGRVIKLGCFDSWNNQSDFGFQIGSIVPASQSTAWLPRLVIYYRIWTSDTSKVDRTMTVETKCKPAPPTLLAKIPNLTVSPQDCSPCGSHQIPFVEVQDGAGRTFTYPPHVQDTARMSLNKSMGMRACFKFQGYPAGYASGQDPQLQVSVQSLLSDAAGKALAIESKSLNIPMLRPSTIKMERRAK